MEKENITAPFLMLFAGPNGSGKTTFYTYLKLSNPDIANVLLVNPDVIAKEMANELNFANVNELPPELKGRIDTGAARSAIECREQLIEDRESLIIETTASSAGILKLLDKAKDVGYSVIVNYIMLQDFQLNVSRITARVKNGGHYVEPATVQRRYDRAKKLIADICIRADVFNLYDNSYAAPVHLIAKRKNQVFALQQQDNKIATYVCAQLMDKCINLHNLNLA